MNRELVFIRGAMVTLSLIATFVFLMGMGSGFTAILFAGGGTLTQVAALLFLPGLMMQSWYEGRLLVAFISALAMAVVILISVAGSASILSGLVDESAGLAQQRSALMTMAEAKQDSANRLIALDRVTKAQPLLSEVTAIQEQVAALPAISGFYIAAQRLGGGYAEGLITAVIVMLSLLLDGIALLLGLSNGGSGAGVTPVSMSNRYQEQPGNPVYIVTDPLPTVTYQTELKEIRLAIDAGDLKSTSVREIRGLLGCGQQKAMEVARLFKMAEDQLPLL